MKFSFNVQQFKESFSPQNSLAKMNMLSDEKENIKKLLQSNMNSNMGMQNNLSKSNNQCANDQVSLLDHNSNFQAMKKQFNSILNYEDAQSSNDFSKSFFQPGLKNGIHSMIARDKFENVSYFNKNNQSYQQCQSQSSQMKTQYMQQCINQIQAGVLLISHNKKLLYCNKHFRKMFTNFSNNNAGTYTNTGSHFTNQIKNKSQSTYSNININCQINSDNSKAYSLFLQQKIQIDFQYQQQNKSQKDTYTQKSSRSRNKKSLLKLETKFDQILEEQRLHRELQRQSSPKNKQKQEQFGSVIYNQYVSSRPMPSTSNISQKNEQSSPRSPRSQLRKLTTVEVVSNADKYQQQKAEIKSNPQQQKRLSIDCKSLGHIAVHPSIMIPTSNYVQINPQVNSSINQLSNPNSHLNVINSPQKAGSNTFFCKSQNKKSNYPQSDKWQSNNQFSEQSSKRVLQCVIPSSIKKLFSKRNLQIDDIVNYLIIHSVSPIFQKMNTDNQILSVGSLESKNTLLSPKLNLGSNRPLISKDQLNFASKNYFEGGEGRDKELKDLDQIGSNINLNNDNQIEQQNLYPNNITEDDEQNQIKNLVDKDRQSTLSAQVEKESMLGEATTTGDNITCQRSKADTYFQSCKMYNYYIQNNQLHVLVDLCEEEEEQDEEEVSNSSTILEVKFMVFVEIEDSFEEKQILVQIEDITKLKQYVEDENLDIYKSKILSSITHELKTPLNCSIQMLDMLLQNDDISDILKQIFIIPALNSNHLLLNIINDILDLAQINYGKFTMFFSEFELNKICAECINLISMQALQKNLDVELEFDPLIPIIINSDQSRIRQVLLNLLSNALKFTQKGKITIRTHLIEENLIQVDIEDTGCGIPEKNLNKIIGRFGKKDHQNINHHLNTLGGGLGLTIANNLATGLGGNRRLQVQSMENIGSKFSFCIVNHPLNKVGCNFQYQNLFSQEIIKWDYVSEQKQQQPYISQQIPNQYESQNTLNLKNASTNGLPQSLISLSNKSKKKNDDSLRSFNKNNPIQSLIKFNTEVMINNNNSFVSHFNHMSSIPRSINEPLGMSQNINSQLEGVKSKKFQLSFRDVSQHDDQGSMIENSFFTQQQQQFYQQQQQGIRIKQGDTKLVLNDILADNMKCESQLTLRIKPDVDSNFENNLNQNATFSPAQYKAYKQYENSFTTQTFQDAKSKQSSRKSKTGNLPKNFTCSELLPQLPSSNMQNSGSLMNFYVESKNQKPLKSKAFVYQQDDVSPQESIKRKTNKTKSYLSQFREQEMSSNYNEKKNRQKEFLDDESCEIQFNENSFMQIQEPNKFLNLKVSHKRTNNYNIDQSTIYSVDPINQIQEKSNKTISLMINNLQDNVKLENGSDFMEIKVQFNENQNSNNINSIIQEKLAKKDFNIFSDSFNQIRESAELVSNLSKTIDEIKLPDKNSSINFKDSVYDINQINFNTKENKLLSSPENTKISKLELSIEKFTQQTFDKYTKVLNNIKQPIDSNSNESNKDSIIIQENKISKSQEINFNKSSEGTMNQLSYQNIEISKNSSNDNQNKAKLVEYNKNRKCKCPNILIVDDNEFNIYTLEIRLKMYGFITDRATSGITAIELVKSKVESNTCCALYQLIFMDIDMPVKNGYETTTEIINYYKEKKILRPAPISACTAYISSSEKTKAMQSGMQFYITKPINQSLLEETLIQSIVNEGKKQIKQ